MVHRFSSVQEIHLSLSGYHGNFVPMVKLFYISLWTSYGALLTHPKRWLSASFFKYLYCII